MSYYHKTLKESPEAQQYLVKRGLKSAEMVEHFRLGFANRTLGYHLPEKNRVAGAEPARALEGAGHSAREADTSTSRGSLVIPILNLDGEVVQMYGRKITATKLREERPITCTCRDRSAACGTKQALIASKEIILCEALIDALTFWCAGYRNVTTSYGVNGFTDEITARRSRSTAPSESTSLTTATRPGERAAAGPREELMRDGHRVFPGAVSEGQGRQRIRAEDAARGEALGVF